MSVEMLKEANPVPPERTAGSVHQERAQHLLALILAKESSRSFVERLRTLAPPRLVRTITVVGALALLALVFSVTLPFGGGSSGGNGGKVKLTLLDRAAAAVPDNGPIVHVVWRQPDYYNSYSSKMTLRYEEWRDRSSGIDHVIIRKGSRVLDLWTGPGHKGHVGKNTLLGEDSGASYPGGIAGTSFVNLIGEYRKALENKEVVLIGHGRAFGRPVYWVRFRCSAADAADLSRGFRCMERIALDRRSYLPVVFMTSAYGVSRRFHILKVEMISRERAHFLPPAMK